MEKMHIRDNTIHDGDIPTAISIKPNKVRKNKPRRKSNIANSTSILLSNSRSPPIHVYDYIHKNPLNKELFYKDNGVKNIILIEPRQLINENEQGRTAFIVEIVGISVAVVGALILIVACLLYPKRRKQNTFEKSMPLYKNNVDNSQASLNPSFEYNDNRTEYSSLYPKESIMSLSTNSFPTQLAPAVTHQKIYNTDDISTNSRNKRSDNYSQRVTNSVIMDTDNYTHSAMKLFSPFKPLGTSILLNKTSETTTTTSTTKREQYRPSINTTIFTINTPKPQNRESTVDPYSSSSKKDSFSDDGQNDSVFSGYQWTHQNEHVIPPKYCS